MGFDGTVYDLSLNELPAELSAELNYTLDKNGEHLACK